MNISRRFLTWLKKVARVNLHVQGIHDARKPGQTDYSSQQMALLSLFRGLLDTKTNGEFFEVELESAALRKMLGMEKGTVCDQSTYERTLPRFSIASLQSFSKKILRTLRRAKVFGGPVTVAVDATEVAVPDETYEGCGVREHKDGTRSFFYKILFLVLVGPHVPPIILGAQVSGSHDEYGTALSLIRQVVADLGSRFIDVLVADRLYVSHEFVNEVKNELGIDVILEPKKRMHILREGRQLLELECKASQGSLGDGSAFAFREISDIGHEWEGLEARPLRFIEAYQKAPWPDPRGKRKKRARYIVTTLRYGTAEWVNRCLHWRWWIESANWDLKHRFQLKHLPSHSFLGIQAHVTLLAIAYSLFHAFLVRQLGGFRKLGKTLTSVYKLFTRWLFALDPDDAIVLVVPNTS